MVLRGIGRLDMGLATVGGWGIVILAIILTASPRPSVATPAVGNRRWHADHPAGAYHSPFLSISR